jgi:hypothetical protein
MLTRIKTVARAVLKSWPMLYIVWPTFLALVVAGPTTLLACRADSDTLKKWFEAHEVSLYLCHMWPVISLMAIRFGQGIYREHKRRTTPSDGDVMQLLVVLDSVVGSKTDRFATYAVTPSSDGQAAFFSITKPEVQIDCLVDAAYKFFEMTKSVKEARFRVALAEMGPKYIDKFYAFNPKDRPPRNGIEEYQKDSCGFTRAKKRLDLVLVSDIAKELRKTPKSRCFTATKGGPQEGSMIVYPIRHRGLKDVVYCLSVLCSVSGYFKNTGSDKKYYRDVMETFAKRIELEHSLRLIKGRCNGHANDGKDSREHQDRSATPE